MCRDLADYFYPISIVEKEQILMICQQEKIDFLPYHRLGREKYLSLDIPYPYEDKDDMDKTECDKLYKLFTDKYEKSK